MFTDLKVSVKKLNEITVVVAVTFCVLVLLTTTFVGREYMRLRENMDNLLDLQRAAYNLQSGSDELTEQVRCYAETGDREYLEAYFTEANVTKRRDNGLKTLEEHHGATEAYAELQMAMTESVKLMDREYYSMRLTSEAMGYDVNTLPAKIRDVRLTAEDQNLSAEKKMMKARQYVYDENYREEKRLITEHMTGCIEALNQNLEGVQQDTTGKLREMLIRQKLLILGMIISALASVFANYFLMIHPLVSAVELIQAEKPLPVEGSNEFQILAKAYNTMFESYQKKTEHLAYEASHDPLTGLNNRSAFDNLIGEVDLKNAILLVFDVDGFKHFNDDYGHEMGDKVLMATTKLILKHLRDKDDVFRMGGDEFIAVVHDVNEESEKHVKEKVDEINKELASVGEGMPPISVSVGGAYGSMYEGLQEVINAADRALYVVKHKGGSGCEFSEASRYDMKQMFNIQNC